MQPYRQSPVSTSRTNKQLSAKYFAPFQVELKVGQVAYKLKLPKEAQIHNVFHVSQLKVFRGLLPDKPHVPAWMVGRDVEQILQPRAIVGRRIVKSQNAARVQYLVQWEDVSDDDSTWEFANEFEQKYPNFQQ